MSSGPASDRSKVRRQGGRARYDRAEIDPILDAGLVGHLAFAHDGQPYAIPMLYVRAGDTLYLHGARLSRLMRAGGTGVPVCFTVTLVDGLVLARSAFHHSVNYRSVVVLGQARSVEGAAAKRAALEALVEHVVPGRTRDARGPNPGELAATSVLALGLEEASAKVRSGGPVDAARDYALPVWAGELPLELAVGTPLPDARCAVEVPDYVAALTRRAGAPAGVS